MSRTELDALDEHARARGLHRSAAVRAVLRAGLLAQGATPPPEDWQTVARRLEQQAPERWAPRHDPLDAFAD